MHNNNDDMQRQRRQQQLLLRRRRRRRRSFLRIENPSGGSGSPVRHRAQADETSQSRLLSRYGRRPRRWSGRPAGRATRPDRGGPVGLPHRRTDGRTDRGINRASAGSGARDGKSRPIVAMDASLSRLFLSSLSQLLSLFLSSLFCCRCCKYLHRGYVVVTFVVVIVVVVTVVVVFSCRPRRLRLVVVVVVVVADSRHGYEH